MKPTKQPSKSGKCDLCGKRTKQRNLVPGVDMGGPWRHSHCIPF